MFLRIDVGASAVEAVFLGGLKLIVSKSEAPPAESPRGGGSRNIGGKPVVAGCVSRFLVDLISRFRASLGFGASRASIVA